MLPRLGQLVRSMRPSQRRALGGLLAVLILSLLYSGSYAVLRLNGYLVRGSSTDYGDGMYAGSGFHYDKGGAFYADGSATMWGHDITDRTPLHTLRFFTPMIRIEMALRGVVSRFR
jgi:hypothetical protein